MITIMKLTSAHFGPNSLGVISLKQRLFNILGDEGFFIISVASAEIFCAVSSRLFYA
jgi:hypothetical protein